MRQSRSILKVIGCLSAAIAASGQSQPPNTPRLAVSSVKQCRADLPSGARTGGISSPGLLDIDCQTLMSLVQMAYVSFATGRRVTPDHIPIEGGPAWKDSERWEVKAKAESAENPAMMQGPMLQKLLEERFGLKIHRETRTIPVYALTVAKSGPRLKPFKEGTCNPYDIAASFPPPPVPENPCLARGEMKEGLLIVNAQATTLADFARFYLGSVDRPVIERTGLSGRFDIHLEFAPEETWSEPSPATSGPSVFSALQEQLGLRLEPTSGPAEYLVIDHAERPSDN